MIGKKIYEIRMKKGMTLSELAEKANVSKSYLSNIERNVNINPSIQVTKKLANALAIDLNDLINKDSYKDEQPHIPEKEWIDLVNQLKEAGMDKNRLKEYKTLIEFIKWKNQNTE